MRRMEWLPYFKDSKEAIKVYQKDYELNYNMAKEYGFLEVLIDCNQVVEKSLGAQI